MYSSVYSDLAVTGAHLIHPPVVVWVPNLKDKMIPWKVQWAPTIGFVELPTTKVSGIYRAPEVKLGLGCLQGHVHQVLGLKDALKPATQFSSWCPLLPSMYRGIQKICLAGRYPSSFVQLKQYLASNKTKFWPRAQCDFLLLWVMPSSRLARALAAACLVPELCKAMCSLLGWGQDPGSPGLSPPPSPCARVWGQLCISERQN